MVDNPQAGDAQHEVVAFLSDPASWPGAPGRVDIVETHCARVFLAGDQAIKVKRAIKLAYLDFSTLDLRHRFCAREMEINQPHAPSIYMGLVAITREADGRLALDGNGPAVEWGIRMRRFSQDDLLSRHVAQSGMDDALAQALAGMAFAYHKGATPDFRSEATAGHEAVIEEVCEAFATADAEKICTQIHAFQEAARHALVKAGPVLAYRAACGAIRRCHGDLHLGNIVLENGKPIPFDAIEFDEDLATIDTLYDLAFLIMDVLRHGEKRGANRILNHYLRLDEGYPALEGLAALPLFLALRAAIRARVALDRARQVPGEEKTGHEEQAASYLDAARHFLDTKPARLIAVSGLSGTGKSTLAARLAPDLGAAPGAIHLRSDVERKSMLGVGDSERLGAEGYSEEVTQAVYQRLIDKARPALKAGHCVIVDAVYARCDERAALEDLARATGVAFTGLWLTAPFDVLVSRVETRTGDASDADANVVRHQAGYEVGPIGWSIVDAGSTPEATLAAAQRVIAEHGIAPPSGP